MRIVDRFLVAGLAIALVAFSALAIGPAIEPASSQPTPPPDLGATSRYVEGVLGHATNASPFGARTAADRAIVALLFRGLVRLGPGDSVVPDLAVRWEVADGGRTWTFHLRPGQVWQDGEPLTADDVAFTVMTLASPDYTGPGAASWRDVSATVLDPLTVALHLTAPLGGFLQAATQPIAPKHLLDGISPADLPSDPFGSQPIGSGPYELAYLDSAGAVLRAIVPGTTQAGDGAVGPPDFGTPRPTDSLASAAPTRPPDVAVPYIDEIDFWYYDDPDQLRADWEAGKLDAASGLAPADAVALASTPGARLVRYPGATVIAAALNLRASHKEFQDPAVRRALLAAIDRDAYVAGPLAGLGIRAESLIPPSSPLYDPGIDRSVPFDPGGAIAALQKAGWKRAAGGWIPKGAKEALTIEVLSPEESANPTAYAAAAAIVASWQAIGFSVSQTPLAVSDLLGTRVPTGDFQVVVLPLAVGLDPDLYPLLASSQARTGGSNIAGLQDPALDKLLVAARGAVGEADRTAAYTAVQARLASQRYLLPIAFRDEYVVLRDTVLGPTSRPVGSSEDRFWDVLTWRLANGR